jgi:Tol biopolymer transport system component/DNA-binding winged helix-turn-helix (wHTH) protein
LVEENQQLYEFDEFRLDAAKRQLLREGEVVPLYSKAFDLLLLLVKSSGRDLTKDEIFESVWPGQILEESNLTVNISAVRRALGEKAAQPRYLITIPGRGYRFVANVRNPQDRIDELVIESQTIRQITVEEESQEINDPAILVQPRSASLGGNGEIALDNVNRGGAMRAALPASITASPSRGLFRRPLILAALLVFSTALIFALAFAVYRLRQAGTAANRFQQIKLRQLTNNGGVATASISPDGKFFVFVQLEKGKQSLRLGQMNGEAPLELRPLADVVYRGVEFAPDGSSIYYVIAADGQFTLYRLPVLGGVPVKMRDNFAPYFTIAPDSKRVAFLRGDATGKNNSILFSNLEGANERVLLTVPANRNMTPNCLAWSPDGSMIAVGASPEGNETEDGLFLLQIASGELKPLTRPQWREIGRIAWLKDGSGIVAIAAPLGTQEDRQIWLAAYPSGEVRRITSDLSSYSVALSVASDSNSVLTTAHQQINNIWLAPADNLVNAKQLTFGSINRGDGLLGLDWTPNGKIVYTSAVGQSTTIWIMDADGVNARELTPPGSTDTTPSVTGDGRFIVFKSERNGGSEIWRMNIDGSEPRQITTCGKNSQANVAPDGKWIVYETDCDSVGALWRVSIDGGQPMRLTQNAASWPWVSPDSKLVACEYNVDGKSKLAIVPIEGGPPVNIFEIPPLANFRYAIRWTADGKAVTYRDWGKGLWRQSLSGGPSRQVEGLPEEKIYSNGWSRDGKLFAFTRGVEIRDVVMISNAK